MADNLSPENKPIPNDPNKVDKKAILETPPQGTPIPVLTPPAAPVNAAPDKKAIPETPPQSTPVPVQIPPAAPVSAAPVLQSNEAAKVSPAPATNTPPIAAPPLTAIPPKPETPALVVPESAAALPDVENPYILSGEVDRARLVAQTRLFRGYIEKNAKQFVGENIKSILDLGCGEGQITQVLARLYPTAQVVGIDRDEKAIEAAQRAAKDIPNIKFEVGDVLKELPAGPFDLVYESIVLQHVPGTPKVLNAIYNVLKPGGYLWTKDLHTSYITAIDHPAWKRLMDWLVLAADKIGAPWRIGSELPPILTAAGFTVLRSEKEVYPVGNISTEGRISMSINFGAVYNARKMISKVLPVTESDIEQAYKELIGVMLAPNGPQSEYLYINTISQRPETVNPA